MKSNQILVGVIIALIGVFSIVRKFIAFDFGAITMVVIGLAFLLLYRQKKSIWALFVGGYMSCFGLSRMLAQIGLGFSTAQMLVGIFFIVPGAIFMVLYFDKSKHGLLVPACILLWLGAGFVLTGVLGLGARGSIGMLVACVGCGFCTVYLIGKSYLSRGLLHIGILLAAIGVLFSGGIISLTGGIPQLVSYVMIGVGVLIVIKSVMFKSKP